jgi:hypothetical protein
MAESITDERLELILESVGEHLVIPEPSRGLRAEPDAPIVSIDTAEPRQHRRTRRPATVAIAAVALLVVAAAVGPLRSELADAIDWLTFGMVSIEQTDSTNAYPSELPPLVEGAETIPPEDTVDYLGHPLPSTDGLGLGAPDRFAFTPPEDDFLIIWEEDGTTLWVTHTDEPPETRTGALLDEVDVAEAVPDLGASAVSITGDDVLSTPVRQVAAKSVVLWIANGHEYRLESDRDLDDLIEGARTITTPE